MAHILYNLCKGKFCVMRMSIAFCLYYFFNTTRFFRFSQVPTQANACAINVH